MTTPSFSATGAPPPPPPQVTVALKSTGIAYLLLVFLGVFGAHRFYIGKIGTGVLYLFTLGFVGIGVIIDLFTLGAQTRRVNADIAAGRRQA